MASRAHISWKTKYAAALLKLGDVPYEDAKQMHEDQIISLYQIDHNKLHAVEADDHFSNLAPMLIAAHRAKSRKDTGIAAKTKRVSAQHESFRKVLLRPCGQKRVKKATIRSRGFDKTKTHSFSRTVRPRI